MLSIDELHVYASDISAALRFYADGMGLELIESELGAAGYALLEPPGGGALLRIFGGSAPREAGAAPQPGRVGLAFSVSTSDFENVLSRALSNGGRQLDQIETYADMRVAALVDPDGNVLELVEAPGEPDESSR